VRLQLFLAFHVGDVALLHVLIDSLEPLFVLLHALGQILFGLFLLLEDIVVIDLLHCFPFCIHLLLNIQNEAVLVPDALHITTLNESVSDVVASDSAGDLLHICTIYAASLLLDDLECLNQIFVLL